MPKGWVYILVGGTGTLYTGVSSKLSQRVLEHKRGIKSGFASKYHCDRLAYFEEYGDIRSAIAREKTIKGWTRAKKIALIESLNPEWKDLAQYWGSPTLVPGQSMQEENDRQRGPIQLPMDSSLRRLSVRMTTNRLGAKKNVETPAYGLRAVPFGN